MTALLLVTWFLGSGAMNSYQAPLPSMFACLEAKALLQQEADNLKAAADADMAPRSIPGGGTITPVTRAPIPRLIAVCVSTPK